MKILPGFRKSHWLLILGFVFWGIAISDFTALRLPDADKLPIVLSIILTNIVAGKLFSEAYTFAIKEREQK